MLRNKQLWVSLLYAFLATAFLSPLASNTVLPSAPDLPNHVASVVQAKMALDEGQFPLRVAPWQHNGWRYPLFQFYSQLPYFSAGVLYKWIVPSNPYVACKIILWFALFLSGFFIFLLTRRLTNSYPNAILSGAVYMSAPYFLINIHARGAFTEAVAQGILPIVLYSNWRCFVTPGLKWVVFSGLSWYALAVTHNITFIYSSLFLGMMFFAGGGKGRKAFRRFLRLGLGYGLGILLALYFLYPVLSSSYLTIRSLLTNPFDSRWLTPLSSLFSPVSVPPEPATGRLTTPFLHPAIGWQLLSPFGILCFFKFYDRKKYRRLPLVPFLDALLALFVLVVFMVWSPFDFWSFLPTPLRIAQFSYRLLTHTMWIGAILFSYAMCAVFGKKIDRRSMVLTIAVIYLFSASYFPSLQAGVKIDSIKKSPDIGYGRNDYLVSTKFLSSKTVYGFTQLPLTYEDGWMRLGQEREIPSWTNERSAKLCLKGKVPEGVLGGPLNMTAFIGGVEVGKVKLESGPFQWEVSLAGVKAGGTPRLKFETDKVFCPSKIDPHSTDGRSLAIFVTSLTLERCSSEQTFLPVYEVQDKFIDKGGKKVGEIFLPEIGRNVQLPILFYPNMLKVVVDGKPAPYFGVSYRDYYLAGVKLPAGKHRIEASFVGVRWANLASLFGWLAIAIWGLYKARDFLFDKFRKMGCFLGMGIRFFSTNIFPCL